MVYDLCSPRGFGNNERYEKFAFLCLVLGFGTRLFHFILYSLGVVNYNKEPVYCCLPYFRECNKFDSNVVEHFIELNNLIL